VEAGRAHAPVVEPAPAVDLAPEREGLPPIPWHFKALCAAATIYLGWRAVQGIQWLTGHL
jgi:hypothetical protein